MRIIATFAVVAAVLMAIGIVAAELVREDPPKILFRRPVIFAGVRGESSLDLTGAIAMDEIGAGSLSGEV